MLNLYFVLLINFSFIKLLNILVAINESFTFFEQNKANYQENIAYIVILMKYLKHFKDILHNCASKLM